MQTHHKSIDGQIAEKVVLATQVKIFMFSAEFPVLPVHGAMPSLEAIFQLPNGSGSEECFPGSIFQQGFPAPGQAQHPCCFPDFVRLLRLKGGDSTELLDVVWASGLDSRTNRREPHSAERLAQHDSSSRRAVDVEVPCPDFFLPELLFPFIEAFQPGGQSVSGGISNLDGLFQILCAQHRQQRPEELGEMGMASWEHTPF